MNNDLNEFVGADAARFYENAGYEFETRDGGRKGIVRGFGSQWELLDCLTDRI